MQKVLIPTDFQINSVLLLKQYLQENSSQPVKVTFLYGQQPSYNIHDLLFYKEHEIIEQAINTPFKDGIEILQNKFKNIVNINYEVFTGVTSNAFNNYCEQKEFDSVLLSKNYKMKFNKRNGYDFQHLIHFPKAPALFLVEIESVENTTNSSLLNVFTL